MNKRITTLIAPAKLTQIARQTGFLRRTSRLKPEEFIDTMLFCDQDHNRLSLQDCCNDLAQHHQKSLSKVALHKRFNTRSFDFLKAVLAEQMASKLACDTNARHLPFAKIMIADSCKFALPRQYEKDYPGFGGARSKALMNIQYAFDLKHGNWENLELTKVSENDMAYSKRTFQEISKGDLHIRDLGYVTHGYLHKIVKGEAFFLNRLHPRWNPLEHGSGKTINWRTLYQKMQEKQSLQEEITITIGKDQDAFDCRLIIAIVPEQVWAERLRKANIKAKSVGYELSDDYKHRCRFSLFITNTSAKILTTEDVIQLYRSRWQIELIFKTWKSLLNIHQIKVMKKERLECQLIAKFIWILLNWKIFQSVDRFVRKTSSEHACSLWKFFKQAKRFSYALRSLVNGKINIKSWFQMFIVPILEKLLIEPKKDKLPAFMIINKIFNPLS